MIDVYTDSLVDENDAADVNTLRSQGTYVGRTEQNRLPFLMVGFFVDSVKITEVIEEQIHMKADFSSVYCFTFTEPTKFQPLSHFRGYWGRQPCPSMTSLNYNW